MTDDEPTVRMPVVDEPVPIQQDRRQQTGYAEPPRVSRIVPLDESANAAPVQRGAERFDSVNSRPYVQRLEQHGSDGRRWPKILKAAAFLFLIVAGIAFVARIRSGDDNDTSSFGGPIVNPTVDDLAQATVQIVGLDADGQPLCSGSGTFVSSDGMVLTNAHVVTRDASCDFASLGVAVTADAGRPPQLLYRADLLAMDAEVDLAVISVSGALDDAAEVPDLFPALTLGDSDELTIGDDLRILGYPEIGGETITFTNGSVSGFTAQAGIGDRALIKTDATIAGGNSGGAAIDAEGRLIGIPTKARASESGPAVDCRPLADTNNDGDVDSDDQCVPIGGFLNGIRPINLAQSLIATARQAPPQPLEEARPAVIIDPTTVTMSSPRFSLGQSENNPTEVIVTATGGITQLCLFVDWAGIPDGVEWDGIWWFDGEIVNEYSLVEQSWEFGDTGSNFWMCAIDDENGLASGLYELGFFLGGELIFAEGVRLTAEPAEIHATMWENQTDVDVCGLAVNPAGSGQVGLNELAPGEVIAVGGIATIELPAGPAVVEATDCDGVPVADSAGELDIVAEQVYTIQRPG